MMPTSQLSSDDLKNVRQALIISLTSFQLSSVFAPIMGLDIFFLSIFPELSGGRTCVLPTNFGTEGLLVAADGEFKYSA